MITHWTFPDDASWWTKFKILTAIRYQNLIRYGIRAELIWLMLIAYAFYIFVWPTTADNVEVIPKDIPDFIDVAKSLLWGFITVNVCVSACACLHVPQMACELHYKKGVEMLWDSEIILFCKVANLALIVLDIVAHYFTQDSMYILCGINLIVHAVIFHIVYWYAEQVEMQAILRAVRSHVSKENNPGG